MQGLDIKNKLIKQSVKEILQHNSNWHEEQLTPIRHSLSPIGCSFYLHENESVYFLKYVHDSLYRERTAKTSRLLMELAPGLVPNLIHMAGGGVLVYEYLHPSETNAYSLKTLKPVLESLATLHNKSGKVNTESIPLLNSNSLFGTSKDLLEQSGTELENSPSSFQQSPVGKKSVELFAYLQVKLEKEADVLNSLSPQGIYQVLSHGDINTGNILTRDNSIVFADLEHVGFRDLTDDLAQTILMLESISLEAIHSVTNHYQKVIQVVPPIDSRVLTKVVCSKTIVASVYQILCMLIYCLSLTRIGYSYSQEESLITIQPGTAENESGSLVLPGTWKEDSELPLQIVRQFTRLKNLSTLAQHAHSE